MNENPWSRLLRASQTVIDQLPLILPACFDGREIEELRSAVVGAKGSEAAIEEMWKLKIKAPPPPVVVFALLFLLATIAHAEPNPYSCADVVFLEPGLACIEHWGYDAPHWPTTLSAIPVADMDMKGNLYRGYTDLIEPAVYCGATRMRAVTLYRFEPGHSEENPKQVPVLHIDDKCASSAMTGRSIYGGAKVLNGGSVVVVLYPRNEANYQAAWAVRIYRTDSEATPPPLPTPENPPDASLPLGSAGGDGKALRLAPAR